MNIDIGTSKVGGDEPCFIIAEAGSNHDRDLDQAYRLIDVAAEAGADAVKFQAFSADKIAAQTTNLVVDLSDDDFGSYGNTLHDLYRKAELPQEWQSKLLDYAQAKGIIFLSTPFDEEAADMLFALGVPAFKIASFEIVHIPLLKHVARFKRPMIISTGMASLGDIEDAVNSIEAEGNNEICLLHCGIGYPPPMDDINLAAMDTMKHAFPNSPIGYSDHSLDSTIPIAAVARGAKLIEKHFTLDKGLPGPDHRFALDPGELQKMIQAIRDVEKAIGSSRKMHAPSEGVYHQRGRRSMFAKGDIPAGTMLSEDMIAILRPGIGIAPKYMEIVVGKSARKDIKAHEPILWEDI
jgi:sialic acid synthase SpsE